MAAFRLAKVMCVDYKIIRNCVFEMILIIIVTDVRNETGKQISKVRFILTTYLYIIL